MAKQNFDNFESNPQNALLLGMLRELVVAVNNQTAAILTVFPQAISVGLGATGGADTLPANPVGFMAVANPVTGNTVKVPYYDP